MAQLSLCPCGSGLTFKTCCEPFLDGSKNPPTAEALMRSRYTAFTKADVSYIKTTLAPESRHDFDENGVRDWSTKSKWQGLKIVSTDKGAENDQVGTVEFIAKYAVGGNSFDHHERAQFRKDAGDGRWYFIDGETVEAEARTTVVREGPKVGRNDPCPCGSGKKYKKCCAA